MFIINEIKTTGDWKRKTTGSRYIPAYSTYTENSRADVHNQW